MRKKTKIGRNIFIVIIIILIGIITICLYESKILELDKKRNLKEAKSFMNTKISQGGQVFYISKDGVSEDGTDINNPMSLDTAKKKKYKGGDKILFKRGDIFYGQVSFSISATEDNPVLISSYGEGKNPIISVAKIINNPDAWSYYDDNIFKIDLTDKNNFEGYEETDSDSCDIGFFTTDDGSVWGNRRENLDALQSENDFYCDGKYFYIKSTQNPTKSLGKMKLATKKDLLALSNYTDVSNLTLEYTSSNAIVKRSYPIYNVYLHDCIINFIGGSFQRGTNSRYGNAIEFLGGSSNIIIENNLIKNVYDAGITLQGSTDSWNNISIRNNIIINACYSFELWASENSKGMNNIEIYNNITINQGKGWAQEVRPNPYNSANYVFYSYGEDANMDINIHDNEYYNSERLYYILYSTKDKFTAEVNNKNNIFYIQNDTYAVNSEQYNNLEEYLHTEYNTDQNSTFNYLSNSEIEEISNPDILNSNDYNEIKAYYDAFDIKYRNSHATTELLTSLGEVLGKTEYANILQNSTINAQYEELQNAINNLCQNIDIINSDSVSYTYECLYNLISTITSEYYNSKLANISEETLISLIEDLDNVSDKYKEIYSYYITNDNIDLTTVKNTLNNAINKYNDNLDLDIGKLETIITTAKDLYNNSITTENVSENILNKQRIINISNIANNIIDTKIAKVIEEEKSLIKVEYDKDINTPTNESITATITVGDHTTITNNGGSNKHKFDQNGTFTFELDIKGIKVSVQVTISNINKEYTIEQGYITNIVKNTQILNFKDNLGISNFTISRNGQTININEDVVATGDVLKFDNKEYVLIVCGDINSDGDCGIHDLVSYRKYLLDYAQYDNIRQMAADINQDKVLDIKDLVGIRKIVLD